MQHMQTGVGAYIADYTQSLLHEAPLKGGLAICAGFVSSLLDGVGVLLTLLLLLLVIDYTLGFMRAWQDRCIRRQKMVRGAVKMVTTLVAVIVVAALDRAIAAVTPMHVPMRDFFMVYLCVTEGLSALSHADHLGVRIPSPLRERLRGYRETLHDGGKINGANRP